MGIVSRSNGYSQVVKAETESLMYNYSLHMLTYRGLLNYCEWESRPRHGYMHGLDTFQSFGRPVAVTQSIFKSYTLTS